MNCLVLFSRRIRMNGFDLVVYQYSSTSTTIKLEGRNTDIPYYGLSDLLELLGMGGQTMLVHTSREHFTHFLK